MKKSTLIAVLAIVLVLAGIGIWYFSKPEDREILSEYDISENLDDMTKQSDLVVQGTFTKKGEALKTDWSSDGDSEGRSGTLYAGQLYTFEPAEVLKGTAGLDPISVNLTVGREIPVEDNSSETVLLNDPLCREPEIGQEYILFLSQVPGEDTYIAAGEPWMIRIEDGNCVLETNLSDPNPDLQNSVTVKEGNKTVHIHMKQPEGNFKDSISGTSLKQAEDEIKAADSSK